ncbi:MAG TPA: DUF3180 domain-containing protein [Mycetocola sp.]|uniref:DUF3180 domain-containing protein n=1 Tax=Mycetocola sp. TaxID=1871042 RepID=UPI002627E868|nr:DUF3180 domain-containing protein [Mycetocola sp.]MCU1420099.1 hypothetical protein [Mycetocola sp.]MCU1560586.1 hypothetical protein [Mycetocola sp.]HEV7848426.1 DUF3180 domain-containing protein [Mycetocola sp.]
MNRTRATPLVGLAALGFVAGFLVEYGLEAYGRPLLVPPLTMPFTLLVVAVLVLGVAIPIRRTVTGKRVTRIDPFRAMRIVVLAKASSLVGALLTGASLGAVLYFTTRPVLPAIGSMWLAIASCVGAAVLTTAGLIAEHLCTLPKDEDDDAPGEPRDS